MSRPPKHHAGRSSAAFGRHLMSLLSITSRILSMIRRDRSPSWRHPLSGGRAVYDDVNWNLGRGCTEWKPIVAGESSQAKQRVGVICPLSVHNGHYHL